MRFQIFINTELKIPAIFLLLFIALFTDGQTGIEQNGVVREINSNKMPIPAVQIIFFDATATDSDNKGLFKLVFQDKKAGDPIFMERIYKDGYELVNTRDFESLRLASDKRLSVNVIMAKAGTIEAAKKQYYEISDSALKTAFKKAKKELEDQRASAQLKEEIFRQKYSQLEDLYIEQQKELDALAEKFARTNFDDVDSVYRIALELFKSGRIQEASKTLELVDVIGRKKNRLLEAEKIKGLEEDLEKRKKENDEGNKKDDEILKTQAQLYELNLQFNRADSIYRNTLATDSTDKDVLLSYADYLNRQDQISEAIFYENRALALTTDPSEQALIFNKLGNLYRLNQQEARAENSYRNALKIYRHLNDVQKDRFLSQIAFTLNNLGNYYRHVWEWEKAETYLIEALAIFRRLNNPNNDAFLPAMALTLNNLGLCYFDSRQLYKSKEAFIQALDIYEKAVNSNPEGIIPEDLMAFFDLKVSFRDHDKRDYGIAAGYMEILAKALKIHQQLAKKRPDVFIPIVALTKNNLANAMINDGNYKEAEEILESATNDLLPLAEKNPERFAPFLITIYTTMGDFYYYRTGNKSKAEDAYTKAIEIFKNSSSSASSSEIIKTFMNIAWLKQQENQIKEALGNYVYVLQILQTIELTSRNFFAQKSKWEQLRQRVDNLRYSHEYAEIHREANRFLAELDSVAVAKYLNFARSTLFFQLQAIDFSSFL